MSDVYRLQIVRSDKSKEEEKGEKKEEAFRYPTHPSAPPPPKSPDSPAEKAPALQEVTSPTSNSSTPPSLDAVLNALKPSQRAKAVLLLRRLPTDQIFIDPANEYRVVYSQDDSVGSPLDQLLSWYLSPKRKQTPAPFDGLRFWAALKKGPSKPSRLPPTHL